MTITMVDLRAEAAAEVRRLARARAVFREGDDRALARLESDATWIALPRRSRLKRSLGRRVCLVWRVAFEDASGRLVESRLVAVLVEIPRDAGRQADPVAASTRGRPRPRAGRSRVRRVGGRGHARRGRVHVGAPRARGSDRRTTARRRRRVSTGPVRSACRAPPSGSRGSGRRIRPRGARAHANDRSRRHNRARSSAPPARARAVAMLPGIGGIFSRARSSSSSCRRSSNRRPPTRIARWPPGAAAARCSALPRRRARSCSRPRRSSPRWASNRRDRLNRPKRPNMPSPRRFERARTRWRCWLRRGAKRAIRSGGSPSRRPRDGQRRGA